MSQNHLGMTVWLFQKISRSTQIFSYLEKVKYTCWFLELALYLKASCSCQVHISFLGFIYWHGLRPYLSTAASCSPLESQSATCLFKSVASNSPMRKLLIKLYYRRTSVLWVEKWKRTKSLWFFRNYLVKILVSYAMLINVFVQYHMLIGIVETGSLLSL